MILAAGCISGQPATGTTPVPTTVQGTPVPSVSATGSNQDQMVAFVAEAVTYAHAYGKERALREFSDRNGTFFRGDLYIYAYDFNGTTIAHPVNPEKIGVNRLNEKDAKGNLFIRELRDAALNGSGFVEYYYINPVHNNAVEPKTGFVMKVDDTWWLGSGIYGPFSGQTPDVTAATARDEAEGFVHAGKAYALANGKEKALALFNDRNGPFILGELYIFAYDNDGTVLAWPYRPDQIGVNRLNATDPSGYHHIQAMVAAAQKGSGWVTYQSEDPFRNNTYVEKTSYIENVDGTWFIGAGTYSGS